jgi:hypothetical protein
MSTKIQNLDVFIQLGKEAISLEMSRVCVYSVVYVFLRRWKKPFYLLVMCT